MTIKNAKQCLREEVIPALAKKYKYFSMDDVERVLSGDV